jgi:hypothetical protein
MNSTPRSFVSSLRSSSQPVATPFFLKGCNRKRRQNLGKTGRLGLAITANPARVRAACASLKHNSEKADERQQVN